MAQAYIFDAVRTPRGKGKKDGLLHSTTSLELSRTVLSALKERNRLKTSKVDDVILGCVTPIGEQGGDIARTAVLAADYDISVPAQQINRFCASALEAVSIAALKVMAGGADFAIGGGTEAMSRVPMLSDGGALMSDPSVYFKYGFIPQGIAADLIATHYGFTRTQIDEFALRSHQRAASAQKNGRYDNSIVPVKDINGFTVLDKDEMIREDASLDGLSKLASAFEMMGTQFGFDGVAKLKYPHIEKINHLHTAGNSSAIVDGASAVLVGTNKAGKEAGLKPRALIKAFCSVGSEPTMMLSGPLDATRKVLKQAKMSASDIDLWEINEAFASIVLMTQEEFNIPLDQINVAGGAIALGHPLGATGAMLVGTVLDELERRNLSTALITLCVAGGMGNAMIIERI